MGIYTTVRSAIWKGTCKALEEYFPTVEEQNASIIFSHQQGVEPETSYVVINPFGIFQIGSQEQPTLTDENEKIAIKVEYEVRAQFSFCGSMAADMMHSFTNRINNNVVVWEEFQRNNLQLRRKTDPRNAPQKRDTRWVDYWNMDVIFGYSVMSDQLVDVVEHVSIKDVNFGFTLVVPPIDSLTITTESGNALTTESGDILKTEGAS